MSNPASQPRRLFLAALVILSLLLLVGLLTTRHVVAAVAVGVTALAVLVAAARPTGT